MQLYSEKYIFKKVNNGDLMAIVVFFFFFRQGSPLTCSFKKQVTVGTSTA